MKIKMILLTYENGGYTHNPKCLDKVLASKFSFFWYQLYKIEREIAELLYAFEHGL